MFKTTHEVETSYRNSQGFSKEKHTFRVANDRTGELGIAELWITNWKRDHVCSVEIATNGETIATYQGRTGDEVSLNFVGSVEGNASIIALGAALSHVASTLS